MEKTLLSGKVSSQGFNDILRRIFGVDLNQANSLLRSVNTPTTTAPRATTQQATVSPTPVRTGPTEEELALARWNAARQQANDVRSRGQQTFQTLIDAVKAFRDRAQQGFVNADQDITNQASQILGGNARTAQELQGQSRALGRAIGLGDSSKFNAQNRILGNLAATQGSTLATKGSNQRANQLNLDQNLATAQQNEGQANSYLGQINDQANQIEQGGMLDYGSALNNIVNYQRQLAALTPLNTASVATVAPSFSGVTNTLTPTTNLPAGAPQTDPNAGANPANFIDIQNLLKKRYYA